ncbi:Uncharacterised protein [Streptococcus suis]|uniref:Uncharacterized protein n=1 Tax=Streptococcus suis TaxID=1307 RepID=A0A0Z8IVU5_STRSU|nr:Uncharacterised protein [Streptococcus suis]
MYLVATLGCLKINLQNKVRYGFYQMALCTMLKKQYQAGRYWLFIRKIKPRLIRFSVVTRSWSRLGISRPIGCLLRRILDMSLLLMSEMRKRIVQSYLDGLKLQMVRQLMPKPMLNRRLKVSRVELKAWKPTRTAKAHELASISLLAVTKQPVR